MINNKILNILELKKMGIDEIVGSIYLDTEIFNGSNWSDGQSWNDHSICYSSPTSALIINKNCVQGHIKRSKNENKNFKK